ncbi:aldehyde dehydrogenase [bacterium]|nr:aldehyde dehydrogenase [bacterium]
MDAQRAFFRSGKPHEPEFRMESLRRLQGALQRHEKALLDALRADLGKSEAEGYLTEVGFVLQEVRHTLKHLPRWVRPRRVPTPLVFQPARQRLYYEPLGATLIMAPWNYPVGLTLSPLVGAIAAGNTVVLKPSELAPASSRAIAELVRDAFDPAHVSVVEGGKEVSQALLAETWDHIFFTGGTGIGRIVAKAAAEHLTKVTLELGGKSPAIVTAQARLDVAARRIAWGKFTNAGQTCVAPDYLLVEARVYAPFLAELKAAIRAMYGENPATSPDYGRIINGAHFERLKGLITPEALILGGEHDAQARYIAPTLLGDVPATHPAMQDEIFGPILPVLKVPDLEAAIARISEHPNPLALYVFSEDRREQQRVIARVPFGGGCVNHTIVHLADPNLPFGGRNQSGLGAYHGEHSFEVFSHRKAVHEAATWLDPTLKYPPYARQLPLLRKLLR